MSDDRELVAYGLNRNQEEFVKAYIQHGDVEKAAQYAGRKLSTCKSWMRNPKIQDVIKRELHQQLASGSIQALQEMRRLVRDGEEEKTRLQASKDLLDRAGWKPEHLHTTADKRMEGASMDDVMNRIKELQGELGLNATPVLDNQGKQVDNSDPNVIDTVPSTGDAKNDAFIDKALDGYEDPDEDTVIEDLM